MAHDDGCVLTISTPTPEVRGAAPIEVRLVIKNAASVNVDVPRRSPWSDYEFKVTAPDGGAAPATKFGVFIRGVVSGARGQTELKPGEELAETVFVNRLFDMTMPGRYEIEAAHDVRWPSGRGSARVVSSPIAVEVSD